jgi:hypothetical protein
MTLIHEFNIPAQHHKQSDALSKKTLEQKSLKGSGIESSFS